MTFPATVQKNLATIVDRQSPGRALLGTFTYRVDAVTPEGRCTISAVEEDMPSPISLVDQWPGIGGAAELPAVGSLCLVVFRDMKKDRPAIIGFQPLRLTAGKPTETRIDATTIKLAGTGPAVARVGDTAGGGVLAVAMVGPAPMFTYTPPGGTPGIPSATVTLSSVITSGSSKVTSG